MIANLSKMFTFPFSKRVVILPQDFTRVDLSGIDVFYINWGNNITPKLEVLRAELKSRKNATVIEM
jgi:hypothetical protein